MSDIEIKIARVLWAALRIRIALQVRSGTPTRVPWRKA